MLGGDGRADLPRAVHEDVGPVVGGQVEDGLLPGGERRLRFTGVQPADGAVEPDERPVDAVGGLVQGERVAQHLVALPVVAEAGEGVALVERHLPVGEAEHQVAGVGLGQLVEHRASAHQGAAGARRGVPAAAHRQHAERARLHGGRHRGGHPGRAAGEVLRLAGQVEGLPRVAVVHRNERLADRHPGAQLPVAGLVGRGPGRPEERAGQPVVAQVDHDQPGQPGQLRRDPAQPFLQLHGLPLVAHAPHLAEVQQHVAQHPQGRRRLVLAAVPVGGLLPLVEHGRRNGRADEGVVHLAAQAVDRSEDLAVERHARTGQQLQKGSAEHDVLLSHINVQGAVGAVGAPEVVAGGPGRVPGTGHDRPDERTGVGFPDHRGPVGHARRGHRGGRARTGAVAAAADTGTLVVQLLGFDPVDGAEVVEVLGARSFVAALVGRKQRLPQPGQRLAVDLVERLDLGDDVGQRDPVGEPVRLDAARAEQRCALLVDLACDLRGAAPAGEAVRADPARDVRLFPGGFRHRLRPPHRPADTFVTPGRGDRPCHSDRQPIGHER
ncbi:hypothetical protein [Actinomadura sp. WMMB 499]|uniref:hypothetical protein n=1 Tax=Actinomadura sp. WMMB 499 TaxID=1219491 RepID=UPI00159DA072|nr:hypothetical protein [Actinomadura sp. WMMB 499]